MHGFVGPDDGPEETVVSTDLAVPAPLDVELLYPVLHEVGGEFCDPFTADHPAIMHASQAAAILARLSQPSTEPAQGGDG